MNDYTIFFDPADVDTPAGLSPVATHADAPGGIPLSGTGLDGAVYAPGTYIHTIERLEQVIADVGDPDLLFTATQLNYRGTGSNTTVADFIGNDADSLSGNGDAIEMGPSGMVLSGFIYIPPGMHEIEVVSDDGFSLQLGGVDFSEYENSRATDSTARVANFEGGLYSLDMLYFDQGGGQTLELRIDGVTVDSSAFFNSVEEFTDPPADTVIVPFDEYHPSFFLGEHVLDGDDNEHGTYRADVMDGEGGDDHLSGRNGDDNISGGYGDDRLEGGAGDDVLDGGRGSDMLIGGDGNDLLISRSDAGIPVIGQLAIGNPTREDPDGEVNYDRLMLRGYEGQPLQANDILVGGAGSDTFLFSPQINAKLEIIERHVRSDGTINWAGVAGENNELHDHWVDSFGIDIIADYNANEDTIAVIGHTANVEVEHRDLNDDGIMDSVITVISRQHGGGGAHDQDLLGQILVYGDLVDVEDIITDANVTYGIVESIADVAEALRPIGEVQISPDGTYGYDTRDANGNLGSVTGAPEDNVINPYLDEMEIGTPSEYIPNPTRGNFEQLGTVEVEGQTIHGTNGNDTISAEPAQAQGMPGALGFWNFAREGDGGYSDARGGPQALSYTLYENQALLRTEGFAAGPRPGTPALEFNGEDEFAYIAHDPAYEISQGTIALWVRPDDLDDDSIFLSKDARGSGDGGHFRLGHTDSGGLFLRMAEGDGGSNVSWETRGNLLTEGEWSHVAFSFTENGVTVFLDGVAVPDSFWSPVECDIRSPGAYTEAYLTMNQEPWLLGTDSYRSENNDSAQAFAADDDRLDNAFDGAIAEFGIWGGNSPDDALNNWQLNRLITNGPGSALTAPSGPQPMAAGDDEISGGLGSDSLFGGAGDDRLLGNQGNDRLDGGYGDDVLNGGIGNDVLDGGRGSDLLMGGGGNDILISRSDAGEQRIGQLVLGDPTRPEDPGTIDPERLMLRDWADQPIVGDDVLVGGAGGDHFYFETLINARLDIIMEHVNDDRTIDWAGVAGENTYLHDHWVDSLGIEVIADYNAAEDTISVIGHTANVRVTYESIDTNGDGFEDGVVSIIEVYSQQMGNGGAHDQDNLGYIVVHGDLVREEDIITDPRVTYGIVETIDEIQEAVAPTGETREAVAPDGTPLIGYDSRDVDGNPIGTDPEAYSANPHLAAILRNAPDNSLGQSVPMWVVASDPGRIFYGGGYDTLAHTAGQARAAGTIALSFNADRIGHDHMALVSKDHLGYGDGGHLTIWIDESGFLRVRMQGDGMSRELKYHDERIEAGQDYNIAFSFDETTLSLYVNGELVDVEDGVPGGMSGNTEDMLIGGSSRGRRDDDDNAEWFFDGTIENVTFLSRRITEIESILLDEFDGDASMLITAANAMDLPTIVGNNWADILEGTNVSELMQGLGGHDQMYGRNGNDIMMGGGGDDTLIGHHGHDTLHGEDGNDTLLSGGHNDTIYGGAGNDLAAGGWGHDTLFGGTGDDILVGDLGNDVMNGGAGRDILRGDEGRDTMMFDHFGLENADRVRFFVSGEDMLAFDETVFDLGNLNEAFVTGNRALEADDRLIYNQAQGVLYYDADGNGDAAGLEMVARFGAGTALTVDDISTF